jgi:hypothetical protein
MPLPYSEPLAEGDGDNQWSLPDANGVRWRYEEVDMGPQGKKRLRVFHPADESKLPKAKKGFYEEWNG